MNSVCEFTIVNSADTTGTHRIPHDNVDICVKGIVNVLGDIEIDKVAEMVVHVHP